MSGAGFPSGSGLDADDSRDAARYRYLRQAGGGSWFVRLAGAPLQGGMRARHDMFDSIVDSTMESDVRMTDSKTLDLGKAIAVKRGKLTNCQITPRNADSDEWLFSVDNGDVIANLDGYNIMPMEQYAEVKRKADSVPVFKGAAWFTLVVWALLIGMSLV